MNINEALQIIVNSGKEIEAIKFLIGCLENKIDYLEKDNVEMSACLRAIKKINKNKNEAIDALCERKGGV